MIPAIVIVGADKGGVGKTTVTRALLDYFADRHIATRVFDGQWPNGELKRFAAEATVVNILDVRDQMKVFGLPDQGPAVVLDLPGGHLSPTLQALDDAKLLDDVRAGHMRLVLLHVLGPSMSSFAEIAQHAKRVSGGTAHHFLIKNHINDSQYFDWDKDDSRISLDRMADVTIDVAQMPVILAETLQKTGGSFTAFAKRSDQDRILRGRARTWLEGVWREFDRVKLQHLILS